MKRIYFDPYCFKGGIESQESINIWIAYKEEFKDLKEFFKFCMNDDIKENIASKTYRGNLIDKWLLESKSISSEEFFKSLFYIDYLKDKSDIKIPSKIKEALCINSDWDYIFCAADAEDYYYGFSWETLA